MAKLSTSAIKLMISKWLSVPSIRKDLEHHSDIGDNSIVKGWDDRPDKTALEYTIDLFGAPKGSTQIQLEEYIWNMWCDGSKWECAETHMLGDSAEDTFRDSVYIDDKLTYEPSFPRDMLGEHDHELAIKFFNDTKLAERCIYRMFLPNNQLEDSYRLEVITTPDDIEIVGWWVTVD